MMIKNLRFRFALVVRPAVPARMRQLQADEYAVGGACGFTVAIKERCSQLFQALQSMRRDHQLVWIGTACMRNGSSFPAPNQFRATGAQSAPAAQHAFADVAVWRGVPSLHGMDRNS